MTRYRLRPPAVGRVVIHALATVRPYRAHPVAAERVVLDELKVLLGADQRARVAGKCDDRQSPEHGVDGPALETELAQVGSVQECSRSGEKLFGQRMSASRGCSRVSVGWSPLHNGVRSPFQIEPELLRVQLPCHGK
jgi:hypothetical protein